MVKTFAYSISIVDRFSNTLTKLDKEVKDISSDAGKFTEAISGANAALFMMAAASAATFTAISVSAANLEQALARLQTVTRSTSMTVSHAMKISEESARRFSEQWSASAEEVIRAQFELATAGVAVKEQWAGVQGAFKLARATVGEFITTAQFLGSLLNTFGKGVHLNYLRPMEKVRRLTDTLTTVVQRFQATLPVLQEGFKFIVGPATQLSLKFEEMATALGILNTAGFRGTIAGTALANMLNKVQRSIERLNLNQAEFTDLQGNLTDLVGYLDALDKALHKNTALERLIKLIKIFDIRAGRVATTIIEERNALRKQSLEIEASAGATEKLARIVETTTKKQFQQFLNSIQNIGTAIGSQFNRALKLMLSILRPIARALARFTERNATLVASVIGVTAAIISLNIALKALKFIFKTILLTQFAAGVTSAKEAVAGLGKMLRWLKIAIFTKGILKLKDAVRSLARAFLLLKTMNFARTFLVLRNSITSVGKALLWLRGILAIVWKFLAANPWILFATAVLGALEALTGFVSKGLSVVWGWLKSIWRAIFGTDKAFRQHQETINNIKNTYGAASEVFASYSGELNRFDKALKATVNTLSSAERTPGATPFAKQIRDIRQQMMQMQDIDPASITEKRIKLLQEAFDRGFDDMIKDLAEKTGLAPALIRKMIENINKINIKINPKFTTGLSGKELSDILTKPLEKIGPLTDKALSRYGRLSVVMRDLNKASQLTVKTMAGGDIVTAKALTNVISSYVKLTALKKQGVTDVKEFTSAIVQQIAANSDLRSELLQTVRDLNLFTQAQAEAKQTGEELTYVLQHNEKYSAIWAKLTGGIHKYLQVFNELLPILTNTSKIFSSFNEILNRHKGAFEKATKAADSFTKKGILFEDFAQRSREATQQWANELPRVSIALEIAKKSLERLQAVDTTNFSTNALRGFNDLIKKLKGTITDLSDTRVEMQNQIIDTYRRVAVKGAEYAAIGIKKLTFEQKKAIDNLAKSIQTSLKSSFSNLDFSTPLVDRVKRAIAGNLFQRAMRLVSLKMVGALGGADLADKFLVIFGQAISQFDAKKLTNKMVYQLAKLSAKKVGIPLELIGLDDVNKSLDSLAKKLGDLDAISIGLDPGSQQLLNQLKQIITQIGDTKLVSIEQLQKSLSELKRLYIQAQLAGATQAANRIQQEFRDVSQELHRRTQKDLVLKDPNNILNKMNQIPPALEQLVDKVAKSSLPMFKKSGEVAAEALKTTINTLPVKIQTGADHLKAAGETVKTKIEQGAKSLLKPAEMIQRATDTIALAQKTMSSATGQTTGSINKNTTLNIKTGDRTINLFFQGKESSGTSDEDKYLEEDEIREIVQEYTNTVKDDLQKEIDDLEDRLRSLR